MHGLQSRRDIFSPDEPCQNRQRKNEKTCACLRACIKDRYNVATGLVAPKPPRSDSMAAFVFCLFLRLR